MTEEQRAREIVAGLTLEEKASLCSGEDYWDTKPIARAGIVAVKVSDGPHGVRRQVDRDDPMGASGSMPATCFPTASALAASWDRELIGEVGRALAAECIELGVDVLLGPGVNLKRSPLCGRNFEYFSEDPLLTGEMAAAFVTAVQSEGIGTSLKHFAGNDQETRRLTIDAVYDERTLRELELTGFEIAVRRAQPWTVMGAYNRLNGTYACENPWLLTKVLREEWGFRGIVVTDWGAISDRVAGLAAGCDLEMPGVNPASDASLVAAVSAGGLAEAVLDGTATRLVALALRAEASRRPGATFDRAAHHALARRVAGETVVLCRNEREALPILNGERVALLGRFASESRYQGAGSSQIVPTRLDTLHDELTALLGEAHVSYARGYADDDQIDDRLIAEAVTLAQAADVTVVCVGLPQGYETEGRDRRHLELPPAHNALVAAVATVHDRVVVVLSNGAPVEMPWVDDVAAVVEGYLAGQAGGGGLADVLTGSVNPSGRLAETFPRRLQDVPSTRRFPGGTTTVEHREGLYVGYRFHDTVGGDVLFCFGHGLSYTTFEFHDVRLDSDEVSAADLAAGARIRVTVAVTNTGQRAGKQVVQVYVRDVESSVYRPDRELKGFAKVHLEPGETRQVDVELDHRLFAFWDVATSEWVVEPGAFDILVGASSRDLPGSVPLHVTGQPLEPRDEPAVYRRAPSHMDVDAASYEALLGRPLPPDPGYRRPFTRDTPLFAVASTTAGRMLTALARRRARSALGGGAFDAVAAEAMVGEAPLRAMMMTGATSAEVGAVVDLVNGRYLRGGASLLRSIATRGIRRIRQIRGG